MVFGGLYERYDRQLMVFGVEGQERLRASSVAIIGAGGLGSPAILYLAAAGVGKIIVVDSDTVSLPDLNRQILYRESDVGKKKALAACERVRELNSSISVECIDSEFNEDSGREIVKSVDIVVDAVDNWETRYAINKLCVELRKPFVHAGIEGWYGQVTTVVPGKTPCLRCVMPKPIPRRRVPVVGVTPGVLGAIEAAEVIKYLLGVGETLAGRILIVDLLSLEFRVVGIRRNPSCPVCGGL